MKMPIAVCSGNPPKPLIGLTGISRHFRRVETDHELEISGDLGSVGTAAVCRVGGGGMVGDACFISLKPVFQFLKKILALWITPLHWRE